MENRNSINVIERQRELAQSFSDRYRRVWLQTTRFNSVCITVFPVGTSEDRYPTYQMYFAKNVHDFSLENLRKIVLSQS
jgi:hypothetical protein